MIPLSLFDATPYPIPPTPCLQVLHRDQAIIFGGMTLARLTGIPALMHRIMPNGWTRLRVACLHRGFCAALRRCSSLQLPGKRPRPCTSTIVEFAWRMLTRCGQMGSLPLKLGTDVRLSHASDRTLLGTITTTAKQSTTPLTSAIDHTAATTVQVSATMAGKTTPGTGSAMIVATTAGLGMLTPGTGSTTIVATTIVSSAERAIGGRCITVE